MDDHRRSLATPNYSPDVGHASTQGKPKQEQEQEQNPEGKLGGAVAALSLIHI